MKLKVLADNNTYIDQYYYGEPAVSYYIEDGDSRLLLDTGYSQLFLRNAEAMNIDLDNIGTVVISHGHDDHTGGLKHFFQQTRKDISVIAHPDAFKEKWADNVKVCSPLLTDQIKDKCNLILSRKPIKVTDNITFLGEIPQITDFESRKPIGKQAEGKLLSEDYVMDDSAIVFKSREGIYIISGCSHSGICNITEYAKKVCGDNRVIGILGGFHLFEVNEQAEKTITYLKSNKIKELYPCHCTSFKVKAEINKYLPIKEVGVGLEVSWG